MKLSLGASEGAENQSDNKPHLQCHLRSGLVSYSELNTLLDEMVMVQIFLAHGNTLQELILLLVSAVNSNDC